MSSSIKIFYVQELERLYLFAPDTSDIKDDLKAVSATYCRKYKHYYLLCDYAVVKKAVTELKEMGYKITLDKGINDLMRKLKAEAEQDVKPVVDLSGDYNFPLKPFSHQVQTFNRGLARKSLLLALEMGLGKTYTSLCIGGYRLQEGDVKRILVICPNHLKYNWEDEINMALSDFDLSIGIVDGTSKKRLKILANKTDIVIANIENCRLVDIKKELKSQKFDMLIVDEIHCCRNPDSKQSKGLYEIAKTIPYRLGLTGTPISGKDITGYFGIFRILDPSVFALSSYTAFKKYYCFIDNRKGFEEITGYKNMPEFYERIAPAAVFYKMDEVLDMPGKHHRNTLIKMNQKDMKTYKQFEKKQFMEFLESTEGGVMSADMALTKMLRLRQITSGYAMSDDTKILHRINTYKLDALKGAIREEYESQKVVIACNFVQEIIDIGEMLKKCGVTYRLIHGAVPVKERHLHVKDFQTKDDPQYLVCMMSTMIGFNADAAHHMIQYSQNYSYDISDQAWARIYRPSQTYPCIYNHLIIQGTIDEIIQRIVRKKENFCESITDSIRECLYG